MLRRYPSRSLSKSLTSRGSGIDAMTGLELALAVVAWRPLDMAATYHTRQHAHELGYDGNILLVTSLPQPSRPSQQLTAAENIASRWLPPGALQRPVEVLVQTTELIAHLY